MIHDTYYIGDIKGKGNAWVPVQGPLQLQGADLRSSEWYK